MSEKPNPRQAVVFFWERGQKNKPRPNCKTRQWTFAPSKTVMLWNVHASSFEESLLNNVIASTNVGEGHYWGIRVTGAYRDESVPYAKIPVQEDEEETKETNEKEEEEQSKLDAKKEAQASDGQEEDVKVEEEEEAKEGNKEEEKKVEQVEDTKYEEENDETAHKDNDKYMGKGKDKVVKKAVIVDTESETETDTASVGWSEPSVEEAKDNVTLQNQTNTEPKAEGKKEEPKTGTPKKKKRRKRRRSRKGKGKKGKKAQGQAPKEVQVNETQVAPKKEEKKVKGKKAPKEMVEKPPKGEEKAKEEEEEVAVVAPEKKEEEELKEDVKEAPKEPKEEKVEEKEKENKEKQPIKKEKTEKVKLYLPPPPVVKTILDNPCKYLDCEALENLVEQTNFEAGLAMIRHAVKSLGLAQCAGTEEALAAKAKLMQLVVERQGVPVPNRREANWSEEKKKYEHAKDLGRLVRIGMHEAIEKKALIKAWANKKYMADEDVLQATIKLIEAKWAKEREAVKARMSAVERNKLEDGKLRPWKTDATACPYRRLHMQVMFQHRDDALAFYRAICHELVLGTHMMAVMCDDKDHPLKPPPVVAKPVAEIVDHKKYVPKGGSVIDVIEWRPSKTNPKKAPKFSPKRQEVVVPIDPLGIIRERLVRRASKLKAFCPPEVPPKPAIEPKPEEVREVWPGPQVAYEKGKFKTN